MLLSRFGQPGIDEDAYDTHLRITVAGVVARDALSEQLVYEGRASARAGPEPSNASADSAQARRPSPQRLVEGLRELKLGQTSGEVDQGAGNGGDWQTLMDGVLALEERNGAMSGDATEPLLVRPVGRELDVLAKDMWELPEAGGGEVRSRRAIADG